MTALVCDTGLRTPSLVLKLLRIIVRGVYNRSTNFGVSIGRFVLDLSANTYQTIVSEMTYNVSMGDVKPYYTYPIKRVT